MAQRTNSRTQTARRRSTTPRRRSAAPRSTFGPIFFVVMGVTIASAVGFMGVVASVLAGN